MFVKFIIVTVVDFVNIIVYKICKELARSLLLMGASSGMMKRTKRPERGERTVAEIRQLTHDHFDERIALSQFAFQMKLSPEKIEEARRHYHPEWEYGLFDDNGRLLSK